MYHSIGAISSVILGIWVIIHAYLYTSFFLKIYFFLFCKPIPSTSSDHFRWEPRQWCTQLQGLPPCWQHEVCQWQSSTWRKPPLQDNWCEHRMCTVVVCNMLCKQSAVTPLQKHSCYKKWVCQHESLVSKKGALCNGYRFQFKGKCGETLPPAIAPHPSETTPWLQKLPHHWHVVTMCVCVLCSILFCNMTMFSQCLMSNMQISKINYAACEPCEIVKWGLII